MTAFLSDADLVTIRAELNADEANRAYPYDDATGKPLQRGDTLKGYLTVGVGWNLTTRPLSPRVRALMLDESLEEVLTDLLTFDWFVLLTGPRMHAVVNLRFNLGPGTFRTFKNFIAAMGRKDYAAAGAALVDSSWWHQIQPSRRERITRQIETGA